VRRLADAPIPAGVVLTVAVAWIVAVGVVDYATSPYLVFATFYFAPVAVAAWYLDRTAGVGVGALAALAGSLSTVLSTSEVSGPIVAWNAAARFVSYVVLAALVAAARISQQRLEEQASTDPLTGLDNRRRFYEQGGRQLTLARRTGAEVTVVFLDLDGLKACNDEQGHEAGDRLLGEFSRALVDTVRASDLVGRVGGDEFCVVLPSTGRVEGEQLVERLAGRLRRAVPAPIRVSAGIVAGPGPDVGRGGEEDLDLLVRAADELMLEAKRSGKDAWRSADLGTGPPAGPPPR
jgi:diguanylate cyclase (GGDEF)-like protein